MNLQIRDPRAHEMARLLVRRRGVSMTEAVVTALEAELQPVPDTLPLAARAAAIASDLARLATQGRQDMTKDEVDEMWGHP